MKYTREQENTILNLAEWSIRDFLETGKRHQLPEVFRKNPELQKKQGVFVSVYVKGKLRGCIGTFAETDSLARNVREMAVQAATEDRRFKPVQVEELPDLQVEISVLSPRQQIHGPDEIEIGKHGIYLIHEIRRATLLPQVAVENNLSPVEFLECCAKNKLGLRADSWKDADLFVYEATVIK